MTTPTRPRKQKKNPAAVALGRRGGQVTSPAKAAAARRNGAKGGRPRDLEFLVDAFELGRIIQDAHHRHGAPGLNLKATTFDEMVRPVEQWAKRERRRAKGTR